MMVSGIPTASGYEERIRFAEMELVDRGANEQGLVVNVPEGREINGWDINVAGVRTTSVKRTVRYHQHAEFLLRVKRRDEKEIYVGRRYGEFAQLHRKLRLEFPGKALPGLPRKNKNSTGMLSGGVDDDADSVSSVSTQGTSVDDAGSGGIRGYLGISSGTGHKRVSSANGSSSPLRRVAGQVDGEPPQRFVLYREEQRVTLRAFLRTALHNEAVANSRAMQVFLTRNPIKVNQEEMGDINRRKEMDEKRTEEGQKFYEIARRRAKELDVHMESFRRDIVERSESSSKS